MEIKANDGIITAIQIMRVYSSKFSIIILSLLLVMFPIVLFEELLIEPVLLFY
jgi:hypothetical protein